jgi:hypothetical protein
MKAKQILTYVTFLMVIGSFSGMWAQAKQDINILELDEKAPEEIKKTAEILDKFPPTLISELTNSIKERGYAGSISFCKTRAPQIAAEFSKTYNKKIYRVSDKNRNPNQKASEDEQKVIEFWLKRIKENQPIKTVYYKVGDKTKVMKPIRIPNEMCLSCHGDLNTISPEVKEVLKKEYPQDRATGYKINDLRGAVVAEF